jgi:hypothetical protein
MHRLSDAASDEHTPEPRSPRTAAVLTYRQIAEILAEREGTPIDLARVKEICRTAERKLVHAMLADPVIGEWLGPSAARVR